MSAKDIFLKAIEIDSPEERRAFVDHACDGNTKMRRRVEALLAANDDPDSYLERPAARFDVAATLDGEGSGSGLSDSSSLHGRFLPGTKVANRYRIVSMLGRGGMGEVYRADDLRLGQTVALKFLPPELAKDPKRLEYFHNEVRLARQIAHPNVCRVYDIGEVDGQQFISMEYIDGEDLKGLLHRIGRLPKDKGIQIAQQLCAGLAAAHTKRVLHRDLKPANIMIDGQGQVRITDFGLATVSVDGENVVGMSGTPAYMAPEHLLSAQTSVQSDLYSLGLILYEIFTGKSAYHATSLGELRRLHQESSSVAPPSQHVEEMDPAVERVILAVLEQDPMNRPRSAAELAAALPGGNPLAAALAAGETPSPELVAASGPIGALSAKTAGILLGVTLGCLAVIFFMSPKTHLVNQLQLNKSPEVLAERARQIMAQFGYDDEMADSAFGFLDRPQEVLAKSGAKSPVLRRWTVQAGDANPGIRFWYRESPVRLFQNEVFEGGRSMFTTGRVTYGRPAWVDPGMRGVQLDPKGHLLSFRAVPVRIVGTHVPSPAFNWEETLTSDILGFDLSTLEPASWSVPPRVTADQVQSWEGFWPGSNSKVFLQAAAFRGRLAEMQYFSQSVVDAKTSSFSEGDPPFVRLLVVLMLSAILCSVALAYRNVKLGRGDMKATKPLATWCFVVAMLLWVFKASHVQHEHEFSLFLIGINNAAGFTAIVMLMYFAFEPLVRRIWPQLLVSWARLMRLRIADALVGREILLGCCVATVYSVVCDLARMAGLFAPMDLKPYSLGGMENTVFTLLDAHMVGVLASINGVVLLLLFMIFRSKWIAVLLLGGVFAGLDVLELNAVPAGCLVAAVLGVCIAYCFSVFGLLFAVVCFTVADMLQQPMTSDPSLFYFPNGMVVLGVIAMIAIYGYQTSIGNGLSIRRMSG